MAGTMWLTAPNTDGTVPLVVLHGVAPEVVEHIGEHVAGRGQAMFGRAIVVDHDVDLRWLDTAITEATAIPFEGALTELAELADVQVRRL